ncbi:MAG: hypothetical protein AB1898_21185 [Acidobacteriota bacterium]
MSRKRKVVVVLLGLLTVALAFGYAQFEVASRSIRFDLRLIGESVYEAHARKGQWPTCLEDLAETRYLKLPYRKAMLQEGHYSLVWNRNLAPNPENNSHRVLAYCRYQRGPLSWFGRVWVCRGDLRVESIRLSELQRLLLLNPD